MNLIEKRPVMVVVVVAKDVKVARRPAKTIAIVAAEVVKTFVQEVVVAMYAIKWAI